MTQSDVTRILTRLAVIESKVDDMKAESNRIRRLEIAVVILACIIAKDGAHQLVTLFGG